MLQLTTGTLVGAVLIVFVPQADEPFLIRQVAVREGRAGMVGMAFFKVL